MARPWVEPLKPSALDKDSQAMLKQYRTLRARQQAINAQLASVRFKLVQALEGEGATKGQICRLLGLSKARIYQVLAEGEAPQAEGDEGAAA